MKNFKRIHVTRCCPGPALVVALIMLVGSLAQAQESPTSRGAGAAKLIGQDKPRTAIVARTVATAPMSCPKCKSTWTARVDYSARGAVKPKVWVEKHLCEGCETTISVVGHGKAKRDVASHKCTTCGEPDGACCVTSRAPQGTTER